VEKDGYDCYHFWDCKKGLNAFLSCFIRPDCGMEMTGEGFSPEELLRGSDQMPWFIPETGGVSS